MHAVSTTAFGLMWATVLGAPPFGFAVFLGIRWAWPRAQLPATVAALATLCFAFGAALLRLSFTDVLANFVCVAVLYFAYCFVAASCLQIPFRAVRYLALVAAALPICVGYGLGTIGVLGLGWIVMDYAEPPYHTEPMAPYLICRITEWGMAVGGSGYTVHLYRVWPAVPFIERQVVTLVVAQAGYVGEPPADKTCADALDAYTR
jgi:hypothetical protein